MAGLDPAIHVDPRVKPGDDEFGGCEITGTMQHLPRISFVTPADKPLTLRIGWDNGKDTIVDISGPVNAYRVYAPLRENQALFTRVRMGGCGADIIWPEGLDMSADRLWRLAQERGECDRPEVGR